MAREATFFLLNCRDCDDILRLEDGLRRPCMCGHSTAAFDSRGKVMVSGNARLIEISYEDYDSAAPGEPKRWKVVR